MSLLPNSSRSNTPMQALTTLNEAVFVESARFLAQRMQATSVEVESGHLSMITHPAVIANLILDAAGAS